MSRAIFEALRKRKTELEVLDVSSNAFEKAGALALSELLRERGSKLKELKCEMNEMGDSGVESVAKALKARTEGERIAVLLPSAP